MSRITRQIVSRTIVALSFVTLITGSLVTTFAQGIPKTPTPAPPFICSEGTLSGGFATRAQGWAPANPADPMSPLVPFANVSLMTFDGEGGLTNAAVNSINGTIIPGANPGAYTLNADCTGTLSIGAGPGLLTFYLVVANRGTEFYTISTNRSVVTVEGNRVQ